MLVYVPSREHLMLLYWQVFATIFKKKSEEWGKPELISFTFSTITSLGEEKGTLTQLMGPQELQIRHLQI